MSIEYVQTVATSVRENVERVIVGKREVIDLVLVALLCEGHVLLEDVPGIGKTTLAKTIAKSLGCSFRRIQCTPDLLPSDVLGTTVYDTRTAEFVYRPGPILAQIVLADEINRATPRTQSALLEAMEERQVSVEGETHALPRPFVVLATQNPIELEGTFPLPEAQLDRFLLRINLGYPEESEERAILARFRESNPITDLEPVVAAEDLLALQREVRRVHVSDVVEEYIVRLVRATRDHPTIELGASPRASLGLYRGAQALAALAGREYVLPDDAKRLAPAVLGHRVLLKAGTRLRGRTSSEVVDEVVRGVAAPVEA
ncbi:MAG: MoxR family ATPase [Dehalococcoidia bacterium]